ncbi:hypothetical protein [Aliikangiella coralliicola]|uniref:Uncharacterized protein n=1 Tax=Aliikangiella coralliicola TaxID=2592383 RepID=A0A545UCH1_9GAMM|nr:hypothetical protein [Aliikangiella coralliicola]TQV87164.1 hypothetical protein FLL46_15280 [Aliikangiella coralliicola]
MKRNQLLILLSLISAFMMSFQYYAPIQSTVRQMISFVVKTTAEDSFTKTSKNSEFDYSALAKLNSDHLSGASKHSANNTHTITQYLNNSYLSITPITSPQKLQDYAAKLQKIMRNQQNIYHAIKTIHLAFIYPKQLFSKEHNVLSFF